MHALKTASYTVRGPVVLGARLAGAATSRSPRSRRSPSRSASRSSCATTCSARSATPRATGKPAGDDLREGKRTALVVDALRRSARRRGARRACSAGATRADDDVRDGRSRAIEACGARGARRGAHRALLAESRAALDRAALPPGGPARCSSGAIDALTERRS